MNEVHCSEDGRTADALYTLVELSTVDKFLRLKIHHQLIDKLGILFTLRTLQPLGKQFVVKFEKFQN